MLTQSVTVVASLHVKSILSFCRTLLRWTKL